MRRIERLIREVNVRDLMHRKGWRPSQYAEATADHLAGEVAELGDALLTRNFVYRVRRAAATDASVIVASTSPESIVKRCDDHVLEEMGDVYACLLQIAYRMGYSVDEIEAEAERKVRMRFEGGDAIELADPGDADVMGRREA